MTEKTTTYATIGTVSAGTMRSEDLIPAFADLLDKLRDPANLAHAAIVKEANELIRNDLLDSEDADWILHVELRDALNEYAPPYSYFGTNEGDGADYGYWVDMDYLNEDIQYDSAPVPSLDDEYRAVGRRYDRDGYIVHVNDHGNVTLYEIDDSRKDARPLYSDDLMTTGAEIWSLV